MAFNELWKLMDSSLQSTQPNLPICQCMKDVDMSDYTFKLSCLVHTVPVIIIIHKQFSSPEGHSWVYVHTWQPIVVVQPGMTWWLPLDSVDCKYANILVTDTLVMGSQIRLGESYMYNTNVVKCQHTWEKCEVKPFAQASNLIHITCHLNMSHIPMQETNN